jgi:uncharacterized protein YdaU (DUF1376 family)
MAKDPAFLFYPGDWQGGTMYLTHEQKGCYMDLLILQFNQGKFTLAQAKQVIGICFTVAWPMLQQKFKSDGTFFWNDRLNKEIEKRQKFTKSRRDNALGGKNKQEHMPEHMENENRNKDETVIEIQDRGSGKGKWNSKPGKEMLEMDLDETKAGAVKQLFKLSKNHNLTNEELKGLWYAFKIQNFTGESYYASANKVYSHFINWAKTQTVNGSATHQPLSAGGTKRGTSHDRIEAVKNW